MRKSIFALFVVGLMVVYSAGTGIFGQQKDLREQTVDQRIKGAQEEYAKEKQLNDILEKTKQLRDRNKKLEAEAKGNTSPALKGSEDNTETTVSVGASPITTTPLKDTGALPVNDVGSPQTGVAGGPLANQTPQTNADSTREQPQTQKSEPATTPVIVEPVKTDSKIKPEILPVANPANDDSDIKPGPCNNKSQEALCELAESLRGHFSKGTSLTFNPTNDGSPFAAALIEQLQTNDTEKAVLNTQAKRTDKQIGSDSQSSGTTNLVTKGGIPLIMSFATEHGAATSSVNGTTLSYRFNPVGLVEFLTHGNTNNLIPIPPQGDGFTKFLRRTAFGLSYDISRGVPIPTFTGSREQLSGLFFRYEFKDERSPNNEIAIKNYTVDFVKKAGMNFATRAIPAIKNLFGDRNGPPPAIDKFIRNLNDALASKTPSLEKAGSDDERRVKIFEILREQFGKADEMATIKNDKTVYGALKDFGFALENYQREEETLQHRLKRSQIFTFDYNYNRSFTASSTSNVRLIWEKGWNNGTDFTFNSSFTFFHQPNLNAPVTPAITAALARQKRFKDFNFALQYDVPLSALGGSFKDSTFTLAAKYQRMNTNSVTLLNGTVIDGLKGDILLGQARLLLPVGNSGLFFPISFTYANRTELIKEKKSRGNFGFTFDFSSLLQKYLNPFH